MPFSIPQTLIDAGGWAVAASLAIGFLWLMITEVIVSGKRLKASEREKRELKEQIKEYLGDVERYSAQVTTLIDVLSKKVKA